jgi:hypothetical protein
MGTCAVPKPAPVVHIAPLSNMLFEDEMAFLAAYDGTVGRIMAVMVRRGRPMPRG